MDQVYLVRVASVAERERDGFQMAVGIFAGIAVNDFRQALAWYKRLLGAEPAFYPNDIEAVWELAEDRYVYIIENLIGPAAQSA